jgi:hypothetical protein
MTVEGRDRYATKIAEELASTVSDGDTRAIVRMATEAAVQNTFDLLAREGIIGGGIGYIGGDVRCLDCQMLYREFGLDTVLPDEQWRAIHDSEGGVLCAACIVKRASKLNGGPIVMHAWIEMAGMGTPMQQMQQLLRSYQAVLRDTLVRQPPQDPITAAVDADLKPLREGLIEAGHKLAQQAPPSDTWGDLSQAAKEHR